MPLRDPWAFQPPLSVHSRPRCSIRAASRSPSLRCRRGQKAVAWPLAGSCWPAVINAPLPACVQISASPHATKIALEAAPQMAPGAGVADQLNRQDQGSSGYHNPLSVNPTSPTTRCRRSSMAAPLGLASSNSPSPDAWGHPPHSATGSGGSWGTGRVQICCETQVGSKTPPGASWHQTSTSSSPGSPPPTIHRYPESAWPYWLAGFVADNIRVHPAQDAQPSLRIDCAVEGTHSNTPRHEALTKH